MVVVALTSVAEASHKGVPIIDHYVSADGTGALIANPGGHEVQSQRCDADLLTCAPHDDGDGQPNRMQVRDDPIGSTFKATQDGITVTGESWRGVLRVTAPPRVDGEIRVGGRVAPGAAGWEGGWGREADWLQLQVCRTPSADGCLVVFDPIKFGACEPGGGRLLPARYEGWWLRVADARTDRAQPFTTEAYGAPEGIRPHATAPGVATAIAGQIAPGIAPATDCGVLPSLLTPPATPPPLLTPSAPRPRVVVRRFIRPAQRGRLVIATVTCPARCDAQVAVRQGRRVVTVKRRLAVGTTAIALPRAAAKRQRLRSGVVTVRVLVDGRHLATARARLTLG